MLSELLAKTEGNLKELENYELTSEHPDIAHAVARHASAAAVPRVRMETCPRCEMQIRHWNFESHMSSHSTEVRAFLFLGGERNATNHKELTVRTSITHILNVSTEAANTFPGEFEYLNVPIADHADSNLEAHFAAAFDFIEAARAAQGRVLVHCVQGISRSASVVLAYLLQSERVPLRGLYDEVKAKRPIMRPNQGFLEQLIALEERLLGQASLTVEELFPPGTVLLGSVGSYIPSGSGSAGASASGASASGASEGEGASVEGDGAAEGDEAGTTT